MLGEDKERGHTRLCVAKTLGDMTVREIGRFNLRNGDVLWIDIGDRCLSGVELEDERSRLLRTMPKGVKIIFVNGMYPVAVHTGAPPEPAKEVKGNGK